MPVGHVVKVPEHLCQEPVIRIQVQVAPGTSHTIFFTVMPRAELQQSEAVGTPGGAPGADNVPAPVDPQSDVPPMMPSGAVSPSPAVPSPSIPSPGSLASPGMPSPGSLASPGSMPSPGAMGQPAGSPLNPMKGPLFPSDPSEAPASTELRGWRISGLKEVLQSVGCSIADELSIEKCATLFVTCICTLCLHTSPSSMEHSHCMATVSCFCSCFWLCFVSTKDLAKYWVCLVVMVTCCVQGGDYRGASLLLDTSAPSASLSSAYHTTSARHLQHEPMPAHAGLHEE